MTKLQPDVDDTIYSGDWLEVRSMCQNDGRRPAYEWARGLESKGAGQLAAACAVLENTLRSGRPPGGRAERVRGSAIGLWELKITKPGSTPPHLRLLYIREGRTLWVAIGFTKTKNRLTRQDVAVAEGIAIEWLNKRGTSQ